MSQARMTRAELEEENAALRGRLAEARDLIDDALDLHEVDELEDEEEHDDERGGYDAAL